MPTFGLTDEDENIPQTNEGYFRNFLASSMQFLRRKKFSAVHEADVLRQRQEREEEAALRQETIRKFEERKAQHYAAFKSKRKKPESVKEAECADAAVQDLSQMWLEEYNHPSCTANISVHEVFKPDDSYVRSNLDHSSMEDSVFNSSALNASAQPIFSTSVLIGNSGEMPSSTMKAPFGKLDIDKLEMFTGARPSFGAAVTSTPLAKMLGSMSAKTEPIPEAPTFMEKFATTAPETPKMMEPEPVQPLKPSFTPSTTSPGVITATPSPKPITTKRRSMVLPKDPMTLVGFYMDDVDRKDYNDMAKERFEKSGNILRASIKRTVNEKIALSSKRLATEIDVLGTVLFLAKLVKGKQLSSHSLEQLTVKGPEAQAYTYDVIITYCMGVIDRDLSLMKVIARILHGICAVDKKFESVLLGHLFCSSQLLRMDPSACENFVEALKTSGERRTAMLNKEQSIVKLFVALHVADKVHKLSPRLGIRYLWRAAALALNTPPRVLSTPMLLTAVVQIGNPKMKKAYRRQWSKLTQVMLADLVPIMEENLNDVAHEAAGEAAFISVLRNDLENLL